MVAKETLSEKISWLCQLEGECRAAFNLYTNRWSELGPEGGVAPTCSQAAREQDLLSRLEDQLRELEDQLWVLEDQLRVLENGDKRSPLLPAPSPRSPPKLLLPASTDGGLPRALPQPPIQGPS